MASPKGGLVTPADIARLETIATARGWTVTHDKRQGAPSAVTGEVRPWTSTRMRRGHVTLTLAAYDDGKDGAPVSSEIARSAFSWAYIPDAAVENVLREKP